MKNKFIDKVEQQLKENIQKQDEHLASLPATGEHTGKGWVELIQNGDYEEHTPDLSLEDITNKLMEIFNYTPQETRKVTGLRGCLTKGWVDMGAMFHCGNVECSSCNLMDKLLREEAENFLKDSSHDKPIT